MVLLKVFLRNVKYFLATNFGFTWLYKSNSYAQEGEDLIIDKLFEHKSDGFYVDVGAYHPFRFSNTFLLSQKGWRGINIDPNPESIQLLQATRKNDRNLKLAVSRKNEKLNYYVFADPALNTISREVANTVIKSKQSKLLNKLQVRSMPLGKILERFVPNKTKIDFLNIDVEGVDFSVLQSNNWKLFSPTIIAIEVISPQSIEEILRGNVTRFLKTKNYRLVARTVNTLIFKKK